MKLFRTKPTVKSVERAQPLRWEVGVIRFDDVSFGYGYQSKHLLIEHISFQINPTQKVALIGVDTGKSTILKLLFRLYDPKHGAIEIDGQDIRTVTVESLRKYIGIITNVRTIPATCEHYAQSSIGMSGVRRLDTIQCSLC